MPRPGIDAKLVGTLNEAAFAALQSEYDALGSRLARAGIEIDRLKEKAAAFEAAVPSFGVSTGGARVPRFPIPGEPRNILDRLDDCGVVHQLTGATPRVSLSIPFDKYDDPAELKAYATARGLGFDAVNSNTEQDAPGQEHSYKFGSLSNMDEAVRAQAIAQNLECIELGKALGARALAVSIGESVALPGQDHGGRAEQRTLESLKKIYAAMPDEWRLLTRHRSRDWAFSPAAVQDWGADHLIASALGPKASCLVDLGPTGRGGNVAAIVARLIQHGKLGGFHLHDSGHGEEDAGAGNPFELFLAFHETLDAEGAGASAPGPACTIGHAHAASDPIESLVVSVMEIQRALVQAALVDREALATYRESNDALMASETLKQAFRTDVEPVLAMARHEKDAAIDPVATYRAAGYRQKVADARLPLSRGAGRLA